MTGCDHTSIGLCPDCGGLVTTDWVKVTDMVTVEVTLDSAGGVAWVTTAPGTLYMAPLPDPCEGDG